MSLPKLSEKAKGILEAPEKDLKKLLENSPLGAPPKLSAALGKAGKGVEEEIKLPIELPELPELFRGEGKAGLSPPQLGEKGNLPELPELPDIFKSEGGKAGLSPPELPELPKLEEIVPFKIKKEKTAATPSPGAAPPAGAGPLAPSPPTAGGAGAAGAPPTPEMKEVKEGILRREGKVKEGMLRT